MREVFPKGVYRGRRKGILFERGSWSLAAVSLILCDIAILPVPLASNESSCITNHQYWRISGGMVEPRRLSLLLHLLAQGSAISFFFRDAADSIAPFYVS